MKTYAIAHDDLPWNMTVEIDEEKATSTIKAMVEFWMGSEDALDDNDGDYTITFLKHLARESLTIAIRTHFNQRGIIEEFADLEGWCAMDGSHGIKIKEVDSYSFYNIEFKVNCIS